MPPVTDKSATTAARIATYELYRDTLIQYLFVSRARHYLAEIENIDLLSADQRKPFEDRRQRLAKRQAKLDAELVSLMNSSLINHRSTQNHVGYAGGTYGNAYSAAAENDCSEAADEASWLAPTAPTTNINGLPMVGHVDINGNPYGSTSFDNNDS